MAQEIEAVGIDRPDVGPAVQHGVDHRKLPVQGADDVRIERRAVRAPVAEQVEARRVVSGVRVLDRVRDAAAEGVLERAIGTVGANHEIGEVDRPALVARGRGDRRRQQVGPLAAHRPRIAAHEDTAQIVTRPQLLERVGIRELEHRQATAGTRRHPLEQPTPRRGEGRRPGVHACGRDGDHAIWDPSPLRRTSQPAAGPIARKGPARRSCGVYRASAAGATGSSDGSRRESGTSSPV